MPYTADPAMKKLRILDCSRHIRGRSCQGPEQRIDRTLPRLAGIEGAQADVCRAGGITSSSDGGESYQGGAVRGYR